MTKVIGFEFLGGAHFESGVARDGPFHPPKVAPTGEFFFFLQRRPLDYAVRKNVTLKIVRRLS